MAKQRPSVQKRNREHQKRQREIRKAERAALKRERKLTGEQEGSAVSPENAEVLGDAASSEDTLRPGDADVTPDADGGNAAPVN